MGCTNSKPEKDEALRLCKERRRFIKQAIDSRYAFAASHVSYVLSLRNLGIALRRFAEAEVLIESSLSISDKTPSHSSYPSPSPSHLNEVSDSPLHNNENPNPNPNPNPLPLSVSPVMATNLNYMRSGGGGTSAVTLRFNPGGDGFVEEFPMPPPPPPFPGSGSWDFFDPVDENESFRFAGPSEVEDHVSFDGFRAFNEGTSFEQKKTCDSSKKIENLSNGEVKKLEIRRNGGGTVGSFNGKVAIEEFSPKREREKSLVEKGAGGEREDPSEFITHRAKDFLSSIKDIEHRFFRASESGKEVSRMLEANKIRVGYSEAKGN